MQTIVRTSAPSSGHSENSSLPLCPAWCLRNEGVSSVLLGTSNPEQLTENLGAIQVDTHTHTDKAGFRFSLCLNSLRVTDFRFLCMLRSFRRWRPTSCLRSTTSWATGRTARRTTDLRPGLSSAHLLTLLLNHTAAVGPPLNVKVHSAPAHFSLEQTAFLEPLAVTSSVQDAQIRFISGSRPARPRDAQPTKLKLLSQPPFVHVNPSCSVVWGANLKTMQSFSVFLFRQTPRRLVRKTPRTTHSLHQKASFLLLEIVVFEPRIVKIIAGVFQVKVPCSRALSYSFISSRLILRHFTSPLSASNLFLIWAQSSASTLTPFTECWQTTKHRWTRHTRMIRAASLLVIKTRQSQFFVRWIKCKGGTWEVTWIFFF